MVKPKRSQLTGVVSYRSYMAETNVRDPDIVARGERLRRARLLAGFAQPIDAVRAHGFNENSYYLHENGRAGFSFKYAQKHYAPAYNVWPEWLYSGVGAMKAKVSGVPILGRVGAGAEGDFADDFAMGAADGWLDVEPTDGRIALRVEGDSMIPLAHAGDLAVFGPRQDDPSGLMNRRVMARLEDGRKLFKILRPGRRAGTFDLYSLNSAYDPIEDAKLEWVLPLERLHVR